MKMRLIVLVLCLVLFPAVEVLGQESSIKLEGYVRDTKGNPIKGAMIGRVGTSDETGHFVPGSDFLRYWKAILFVAPGYKPKAVPIVP